jgi:alcohol dehydrogenase
VSGDRPRPVPMVLGHESAGEVVECGRGVVDLEPGDRVVMVFMPSCGYCLPCMEGRPALCEPGAASNGAGSLLSGERRLSLDGRAVNHHVGVSCFADHAVVSRRSCVKIEQSVAELSHAEAALFGCAVLTGAGAVINTAGVRAGSTVAVLGLGGVGFSALLAAAASGARELLAIDLAWRITRRGGTTVSAGLPHPDKRFQLPSVQLVGEERTLRGSYIGSSVPARDIPHYISLYRGGRLPVDRLMGERFCLEDINRGFDRLASGQSMRDIVEF